MPTGVAARCFISTIVPTVEAPAGRCGLIMPCAAFSRRPIRKGVANTLTPGLPIASAVRSGVTVHDTSCVVPGVRSMAPILYRGSAADCKRRSRVVTEYAGEREPVGGGGRVSRVPGLHREHRVSRHGGRLRRAAGAD